VTYREDGSIISTNDTVWSSRYDTADYGVYQGLVVNVIYSDDPKNVTQSEVLYEVVIISGRRNGQLLSGVSDVSGAGDRFNFSETIRKPVRIPTNFDIANPAQLKTPSQLNGSQVYIAFLNGDTLRPIIIGGARHTQNKTQGTTKAEGVQHYSYFNGIKTKIDKDGVFTLSKDLGASRKLFANPEDLLDPYMEEFAPLIGFSDMVKLTIDNDPKIQLSVMQTPTTGLNITLDGLNDKIEVQTALGASVVLDGIGDSLSYTTVAGMSMKVDGISDKFSITSLTGSSLILDGISDSFSYTSASGAVLKIDGVGGEVELLSPLGSGLKIGPSELSLLDVAGAGLKISNGMVALGGPAAELLDLIDQAFTALSTDTYAGFGAPAANVAKYTELAVKIKLIKGSL